jgi:hypothetical protein
MWFITVISSFYVWLACLSRLLEVGLLPGTGCMVPQPYAIVGNRKHSGVLGHNRWPAVPRINYPDRFIESFGLPFVMM